MECVVLLRGRGRSDGVVDSHLTAWNEPIPWPLWPMMHLNKIHKKGRAIPFVLLSFYVDFVFKVVLLHISSMCWKLVHEACYNYNMIYSAVFWSAEFGSWSIRKKTSLRILLAWEFLIQYYPQLSAYMTQKNDGCAGMFSVLWNVESDWSCELTKSACSQWWLLIKECSAF